MPVQAQAGEAQAARDFLRGLMKKRSQKLLVPAGKEVGKDV
jgi:hypothetical protein